MKRGTQEEMIERRRKMLTLYRSGLKPKKWIPIIAAQYNISEDAVKKDWSKRRSWIQSLIDVDDIEELGYGIFREYENALFDADNLYEQAEDVKIKTQLLWLRLKIIKHKYDFLREVGVLEYHKSDFRDRVHEHDEDKMEKKYPGHKKRQEEKNQLMETLLSSL